MPDRDYMCETGFTPERAELDALDAQLVDLVAKRYMIVRRLMDKKRAAGVPPLDLYREATQNTAYARMARSRGIDEETILAIFRAIRAGSLSLY